MKRLIDYKEFSNELMSKSNTYSLYESLNYNLEDLLKDIHTKMYNKVKEFIFGKDNANNDINTIEKTLITSTGYTQNKYGLPMFPYMKDHMDIIWKKINAITNPNNGFLKKSTYDFEINNLNTFENLNLQKTDSLNILSDKNNVEKEIRKGTLKTTLGNQYNNLTEEQRDIINLVNDKLNDKPKMVQDIFDKIENDRGLNLQSNLGISTGRHFEDFKGFQELKQKKSDLTEANFGYYFISLISRYIYNFYVDVVAEQISKSYQNAAMATTTTTTPTKPTTSVGTAPKAQGSVVKRPSVVHKEITPSDIDLSKIGY